jgi:2,3-bisphosphoglycerate-independent phosphoglycerate mutase
MVTLTDGIMKDFTAGHIKTEITDKFLDVLRKAWKNEPIEIFTGKSYRNLLVAPADWAEADCAPPHDITDKPYKPYLPKGGCADKLINLMVRSQDIFKDHPLNKERKVPVSSIWLWGQGGRPQLPKYKDKFGVTGVVISAVDLLKGIARLTGLEVIDVPGATGFIDTNYEGKAHAALEALSTHDMALIHLESTDETGHMGDIKLKIQSIEDCDKRVFNILKSELERSGTPYHVLLMPDHPTPIRVKTHTSDPVPYLLYRSDNPKNSGITKFSEVSVGRVTKNDPIPGHELTNKLLRIL